MPIGQLQKETRDAKYDHVVIDTEANPSDADFAEAAEGCDLLIMPAEPEMTATDGLNYTIERLAKINFTRYRVLLTKVPPAPQTEGDQLRADLQFIQ